MKETDIPVRKMKTEIRFLKLGLSQRKRRHYERRL